MAERSHLRRHHRGHEKVKTQVFTHVVCFSPLVLLASVGTTPAGFNDPKCSVKLEIISFRNWNSCHFFVSCSCISVFLALLSFLHLTQHLLFWLPFSSICLTFSFFCLSLGNQRSWRTWLLAPSRPSCCTAPRSKLTPTRSRSSWRRTSALRSKLPTCFIYKSFN